MLTQQSSASWEKREISNLIEHTLWMALTTPFNKHNLRHYQVQSPDYNCRIYYMITSDTSSLAHFFASKNHINLCRLHVYSCYIYVATLKCILSHWSCIFIKPLNVSNVLYPFPISLEVITEHIFTP